MNKIKKITVLGTGNMGPGIALVFAKAGFNLTVWGPAKKDLETGVANLKMNINDLKDHGIVDEDLIRAIVSKIRFLNDLTEAASESDFVVEAIPEKLELKQEIFGKLENICSPQTIFASNTSTLLPSELSQKLKFRERLLVTHFWNPAFLAPLVEVCGSAHTHQSVIETTMDLLTLAGNKPVLMKKEIPGFIGNRIMHAMNREALSLIGNGVCDAEDIDKVVLAGFGPRFANLGPMEYLDFSGLDLIKNIQGYLYHDLDVTQGVLPVIEQLTNGNNLGIKTGKGLFDWNNKKNLIRENRDKEFYRRLKESISEEKSDERRAMSDEYERQ